MMKLALDGLVVTSYETAAPVGSGDEIMGPNTRGCPVVEPTQYVGCATYACSAELYCATGGGYAC